MEMGENGPIMFVTGSDDGGQPWRYAGRLLSHQAATSPGGGGGRLDVHHTVGDRRPPGPIQSGLAKDRVPVIGSIARDMVVPGD